jgi:hypothetical protein
MRTATRRTAIVTTIVAGLAVTGVAFAAWTSTGTGTATASAGNAKSLVVEGADVNGLFPTGSVTVPVTVTNPNDYKIALSSLEFTGASTTQAGCDASVVTAPSKSGLTDVLGANGGSATLDFTVSMSNAAADACQGASFTLGFTATGASAN